MNSEYAIFIGHTTATGQTNDTQMPTTTTNAVFIYFCSKKKK